MEIYRWLQQKLDERKAAGIYRELRQFAGPDFQSNDYLGFSRHPQIREKRNVLLESYGDASGATGSRLITGNYPLLEKTESFLTQFYQSPAALLMNSGYEANLGLISTVARRGDTLIYDELSHASIREGVRLSLAQAFPFRHHDLSDLEKKLQKASGQSYIITESVFSMDGDEPDREALLYLSGKYNAVLIIDEAHSTGISGNGKGLWNDVPAADGQLVRIMTFGKAIGGSGAVILSNALLRDYLINFARPFIYTTAAAPYNVAHILAAHEYLEEDPAEIPQLHGIIRYFEENSAGLPFISGRSPIKALLPGSQEKATDIARRCREGGIDLKAIVSPTVPQGKERIRICLHAYNTQAETNHLLSLLHS